MQVRDILNRNETPYANVLPGLLQTKQTKKQNGKKKEKEKHKSLYVFQMSLL